MRNLRRHRRQGSRLGCGIAGVEQSEVLRDKEIIEEQLKKERGRYETLLDMRMNNEIPKEVFSRKQQEVGERIAELEQRMAQYGDVKPATEADVSGKLENLQRLMGQFSMPEDGEFSEEEMDRYVSGVRVYEDRFEWLLNLSPDAGGGLDDAGSPVYFKKIMVTPGSINSRISFNKSILSSSPEYMSDLRRIAWYSPSLLTIPFMTLCMRVSMSWYNAESFSNPIPPSVVS